MHMRTPTVYHYRPETGPAVYVALADRGPGTQVYGLRADGSRQELVSRDWLRPATLGEVSPEDMLAFTKAAGQLSPGWLVEGFGTDHLPK